MPDTFGGLYTERSWRWGFILIFAQLPVMLIHAEPHGLVLAGDRLSISANGAHNHRRRCRFPREAVEPTGIGAVWVWLPPDRAPARILLVEDEVTFAGALRVALQHRRLAGLRTMFALCARGVDVLNAARADPPVCTSYRPERREGCFVLLGERPRVSVPSRRSPQDQNLHSSLRTASLRRLAMFVTRRSSDRFNP
jgi:hypothetical protein